MRARAHVAACMVFVAAAAAQDVPPPVALRLGEAVDRARAASAHLAQLDALARASGADERGARALRLPQIDIAAGYTRQSNVPELTLALPGQPPRTLFPNIPDNYRLRAGVTWPLYTGGRVGALVDAARQEHAAVGADEQTGSADLVLETTSAYWNLVTAREAVAVLDQAMGAYDAHLADARNRERFGVAARNEVLAVALERDRAELARLRSENAAALAEANLLRLLGLPTATRIEPREVLDGGAAGETEAIDTLVAMALERRPERAALAARVRAAEARARADRVTRLPQASLAAGFDYANPNRRILPPEAGWNDSWDVSINVGWTLFDGGRARAASDRAAARAGALRFQLEDLERRVRLQVTQRHLELFAARRAVEVAARSVTAAAENERVAGDRHRAGVAASSDRLDAEVGRLRAALDHKEALAQLRLAAAALDRAVGR